MAEKTNKKKKKRVRGFAGIVWKQLERLNQIDYFKQKYKDEKFRILLNATDGKYAALIKVENGEVDVESLKNGDKKHMKALYKEHDCDGKLYTTTPIFLKIVMGELSTGGIVKKVLGRKVKIKGIKYLLKLLNLFNILSRDEKKSS